MAAGAAAGGAALGAPRDAAKPTATITTPAAASHHPRSRFGLPAAIPVRPSGCDPDERQPSSMCAVRPSTCSRAPGRKTLFSRLRLTADQPWSGRFGHVRRDATPKRMFTVEFRHLANPFVFPHAPHLLHRGSTLGTLVCPALDQRRLGTGTLTAQVASEQPIAQELTHDEPAPAEHRCVARSRSAGGCDRVCVIVETTRRPSRLP
jgi:hypothetical protein